MTALADQLRRRWTRQLGFSSARSYLALPLLVAAVSATALLWAQARDPFRRIEFALKTASGITVKGVAVLPKPATPLPIAIYLHDSGGSLINDGNSLRLMAEQNLAAVGLDYDQGNEAAFTQQLIALHEYLSRQTWASRATHPGSANRPGDRQPTPPNQPLAVAWVGCGLGAQRALGFLSRNPDLSPQVLVGLCGRWGKQSAQRTEGNSAPSPAPRPHTRILLVHGENDEISPVADCRRLAAVLTEKGFQTDLRVFPGQSHGFGSNWGVIMRGTGEYCAGHLNALDLNGERATPPLRINARPLLLYYWLPAGVAVGALAVAELLRLRRSVKAASVRHGRSGLVLAWAARLLAVAAAGDTVVHLGLPRLTLTDTTLEWSRRWLVQPDLKDDFDWLCQRPQKGSQSVKTSQETQNGTPAPTGIRVAASQRGEVSIHVFLEHLALAGYTRKLAGWGYDDSDYQNYVLSPEITGDPREQLHWRRALWTSFYPRVRHETDPFSAAQRVACFLRERVTVKAMGMAQSPEPRGPETATQPVPRNMKPAPGIEDSWSAAWTDARGFEHIYVAALRSVGVAARLSEAGRAEILANGKWQLAPRPIL